MKAVYYKNNVDKAVRRLKKVYVDNTVPKDLQLVAANTFLLTKVIQEKQVYYKWNF
jgi:uncharacterized protein (UPF0147 family)